ncbi:MAG: MarR family transcriptional regulator [Candidatus Paraprevotella stercoravium]|uniref:MarR family transcriptional regulator n=1 Tax=Candidatus Paraprevotella stercoravium TaxID=2838725 RepID=A0A9E2P3A9_9BACT|nr:MarR family transcriptional regulator [Candidatus Paraprevotella stercoravium]
MQEKVNNTSRECLRQLIRTRMASRQAMQRFLKNVGADITFEMLQIMSCLWYEQGVSQQVLAERTAKDKACLTKLMLNLERKGYVCRKEDSHDRRNKLVFLTEEGEAFRNWLAPQLKEYYRRLDDLVGEEKLKHIQDLLQEVQHALETY